MKSDVDLTVIADPGELEPYLESAFEPGGGPVVWRFVRGHVDKQLFLDACERGYDMVTDDGTTVDDVRHAYMRTMPPDEDGWGEYVLSDEPGRGTEPITYVEL